MYIFKAINIIRADDDDDTFLFKAFSHNWDYISYKNKYVNIYLLVLT